MKKLLTFIILLLLSFQPFALKANVGVTIQVDKDVEGTTYTQLVNQFVDLILDDDLYSYDVSINDDISEWFTNIPEGLSATVSSVDDNYLTVEFTGMTTVPVEEIILVTVPSGKILDDYGDPVEGTLSNDPETEDSKYIIDELPIRAYYNEPSTVSGYAGEQLTVQYVYIKLENDTYTDAIISDVLSIYNGLTATVISFDENNVAKVQYTGTPLQKDDSLIHSTLKKEHLTICEEDLSVPDREDVRFDIRERPVTPDEPGQDDEPSVIYTIPFTGIE